MWEFILAALFSANTLGMGLFVAYVFVQARRRSVGPKWLRLAGLVVAPVGVSAGLAPIVGGSWGIGALGYSLMFGWWVMLVAFMFVGQAERRVDPSLMTS